MPILLGGSSAFWGLRDTEHRVEEPLAEELYEHQEDNELDEHGEGVPGARGLFQASLASTASQNLACMVASPLRPSSALTSRMPVGLVTLISVR